MLAGNFFLKKHQNYNIPRHTGQWTQHLTHLFACYYDISARHEPYIHFFHFQELSLKFRTHNAATYKFSFCYPPHQNKSQARGNKNRCDPNTTKAIHAPSSKSKWKLLFTTCILFTTKSKHISHKRIESK